MENKQPYNEVSESSGSAVSVRQPNAGRGAAIWQAVARSDQRNPELSFGWQQRGLLDEPVTGLLLL